jgi:hypothetical protein
VRKTYSQVHVNVLEVKQHSEEETTGKAVTLKVNMSNIQQDYEVRPTSRAKSNDQSRMPNMKPLYWKCIWSTIKKPGCKKREADMILCTLGLSEPRMNLWKIDQSAIQ